VDHCCKAVKNQKHFVNTVLKKKKGRISTTVASSLQVLCITKMFELAVGAFRQHYELMKTFLAGENFKRTKEMTSAVETLRLVVFPQYFKGPFTCDSSINKLRKYVLGKYKYGFWLKYLLRLTVAVPAGTRNSASFLPPMVEEAVKLPDKKAEEEGKGPEKKAGAGKKKAGVGLPESVMDGIILITAKVESGFSGMEQKFTGLEAKLTGMEQKFTGVDQKFTGLEAKLTGMEAKLTGLEHKVTGMQTKFMACTVGLSDVIGCLEFSSAASSANNLAAGSAKKLAEKKRTVPAPNNPSPKKKGYTDPKK
jgi:hypothetical protein